MACNSIPSVKYVRMHVSESFCKCLESVINMDSVYDYLKLSILELYLEKGIIKIINENIE